MSSISTIYLNESLIVDNQCVLARIQNKEIQRVISNKYIFYKSINLLTIDYLFNNSLKRKCELVFRFFQINVHLNLKTDENFDLFYRSCQSSLINRENNY